VGGGEYLVNLGPREDLVIGVDRLDYSKGLPNRFRAFGLFLDGQEKGDRRASLLQIAPPSREEVGAYQDIRDELERLSGCINGRHAELDWTPIRYIHRGLPRDQLAVLYRVARVGLVTPLADGMNLVAKEYVAAQDPENPGVLVLSRMAGAAEELTEALLVNPYDVEEMAHAIDAALAMPRAERQRRHRVLMEVVRRSDVSCTGGGPASTRWGGWSDTSPSPDGALRRAGACGYETRRRVISSVVERFVHIEDVGGSNPSSPTISGPLRCDPRS
jgi:trehalose 6-phosphate synthase